MVVMVLLLLLVVSVVLIVAAVIVLGVRVVDVGACCTSETHRLPP